jgi:uncharacterized protein (AIM24 family)
MAGKRRDGQQDVGGVWGGLKRMMVGESLFITTFRARGQGQVAFAAPHPGKLKDARAGGQPVVAVPARLVPVRHRRHRDRHRLHEALRARGCSAARGSSWSGSAARAGRIIHAGGNLVEFDLVPGQTLRVDTGCIVAFEEGVGYDIQFVGGFKNALFGGEGLFLATLTGRGKCILQTLPFLAAGRTHPRPHEGGHRRRRGASAAPCATLGNIFGGNE